MTERKTSPDPVIPPHMLEGLNAAQRKAFGLTKHAPKEAPKEEKKVAAPKK